MKMSFKLSATKQKLILAILIFAAAASVLQVSIERLSWCGLGSGSGNSPCSRHSESIQLIRLLADSNLWADSNYINIPFTSIFFLFVVMIASYIVSSIIISYIHKIANKKSAT